MQCLTLDDMCPGSLWGPFCNCIPTNGMRFLFMIQTFSDYLSDNGLANVNCAPKGMNSMSAWRDIGC